MTSASFAHEWPGRYGRGPKHHHHHHHRHGGPAADESPLRDLMATWALMRGKGRHDRPSPEELEELIALRHMGGGPRGGHGPFGPRGRGRGRGRARRGDVRLAILRLLAEEPRNGYGLMQTIEERSDAAWRPSPGSIYPTLAQLEDEGLIRSGDSDGSRVFEITDAGREHLQARADEPDPWEPTSRERPEAEIRPLIAQTAAAAIQVAKMGDEGQRARAAQLLAEARRGLYRILAEEPDPGADQADGESGPDEG